MSLELLHRSQSYCCINEVVASDFVSGGEGKIALGAYLITLALDREEMGVPLRGARHPRNP